MIICVATQNHIILMYLDSWIYRIYLILEYIECIKSRFLLIDLKSVRYIKSRLIISHYYNSYVINFKNIYNK